MCLRALYSLLLAPLLAAGCQLSLFQGAPGVLNVMAAPEAQPVVLTVTDDEYAIVHVPPSDHEETILVPALAARVVWGLQPGESLKVRDIGAKRHEAREKAGELQHIADTLLSVRKALREDRTRAFSELVPVARPLADLLAEGAAQHSFSKLRLREQRSNREPVSPIGESPEHPGGAPEEALLGRLYSEVLGSRVSDASIQSGAYDPSVDLVVSFEHAVRKDSRVLDKFLYSAQILIAEMLNGGGKVLSVASSSASASVLVKIAVVASNDSPVILSSRAEGRLLKRCRRSSRGVRNVEFEALAIANGGDVAQSEQFVVISPGEHKQVDYLVRLRPDERFDVIYTNAQNGTLRWNAKCIELKLKLLDSRGRSDKTVVLVALSNDKLPPVGIVRRPVDDDIVDQSLYELPPIPHALRSPPQSDDISELPNVEDLLMMR